MKIWVIIALLLVAMVLLTEAKKVRNFSTIVIAT